VKGRYGYDYAEHPDRLMRPLIRKSEFYPSAPTSRTSQRRTSPHAAARAPGPRALPRPFREASWEEALDLVARRFLEIKAAHGPGALAGFGSAKCSNEDNYLFQKVDPQRLRANNVDHCTRSATRRPSPR